MGRKSRVRDCLFGKTRPGGAKNAVDSHAKREGRALKILHKSSACPASKVADVLWRTYAFKPSFARVEKSIIFLIIIKQIN